MATSVAKSELLVETPGVAPGPAARYFASIFNELLGITGARDLETGRTRQAKCTSLSQVLEYQRMGRALRGTSVSSLYRLSRGETSPTIDVVYELARAFRVSPQAFLPERVAE